MDNSSLFHFSRFEILHLKEKIKNGGVKYKMLLY